MDKTVEHYKKMTETPVYKLILVLGIPTTVSMLITNIYNLVDTYFVGTLGESAQGAIGILFTLQAIIQAIAFMLGHGAGAHVSKELADRNPKKASVYASTSFFLGLGLGIILTIFGLIFIYPFMRLLGSTETILPYAVDYGFWVLISAPFMIVSLALNNFLRYEGKAFYAMIGIALGAILNIFGDYLFITICNLGVFGAGMSTGISQIISFIVLYIFYILKAQSKISVKSIATKFIIYKQIILVGLPSFFRQGLASISSGLLNNMCKAYGDSAIAAMSVVNRCSSFVMCVGMGIGQGLQPVASFNYRAKKYSRVKKGYVFTIVFSFSIVAIFSIFGFIMPKKIISIFQDLEAVQEYGQFALRMAFIGLLFLPISVTTNMLYQSIRKSKIASFLALLRSGLIFIPLLYILAACGLGFNGIALTQPLADMISSLLCIPFGIWFLVKDHSKDEEGEE